MNALAPTDAGTPLPANVEVEQAVLGTLLVNPDSIGAVIGFLEPEHFFEPTHQLVYETIRNLARDGRRVSALTIKDHLPAALQIGDMTLGAYIARLAADAALGFDPEAMAREIVDLWIRRSLVAVADDIREAAVEGARGAPPKDQIEETIARLSALSVVGLRRSQRQSTAGAAAKVLLAEMESGVAAAAPIPTGLVDLDHIIGGCRAGTLVILGGRPGMGKSTLAGSVALSIASRGHGVLFFSKEMTKEQLTARLLTDLAYDIGGPVSPLSYEAILNRDVTEERHRLLMRQASDRLADVPLVIDPQPAMTMIEIAVRARRVADSMARRGLTLRLVVIDHLGKVRPATRVENQHLALGEITNAAAALAKDMDCTVLLLSQLNRQLEGRDNKRPQLSDLRESGRIEEDADVVIMAYREAYYLAKRSEDDVEKDIARQQRLADVATDLDAIVVKNRHGGEGVARLFMHAPAAAVRNRERNW